MMLRMRSGIDIIIDLKQNAIPQVVLNKLYKHTQLQVGFGCNMLALVNGVPRTLSLEMLHYYILHREKSSRAPYATTWQLKRPYPRKGSSSRLTISIKVIDIIRSSEEPMLRLKSVLMEAFKLSEKQSEATSPRCACATV